MGCPHEKIIPFNSKPSESIKDEIKESLSEIERKREIKEKRKRQHKSNNTNQDGSAAKTTPHPTFNIGSNSGNVIGSVGDNARFYSKTTKVIKTPPPDTIGAHGHMVHILNDKIKELADTRAKDFVKQKKYPTYEAAIGPAFQSLYAGFRSFMGLPSRDKRQANTIAKERPVNEFDEILNYFTEKLSRTVTSQIKSGIKKSTSRTPFHTLMNREKQLLAMIGFKTDSPEVYAALERYYRVSSHKDLFSMGKHKDWISYIESIVDKVEKGILAPHDIKF